MRATLAAEVPIRPHLLALLCAGCFPDDWDGKPYQPYTTPVGTDDTGAVATDDGIVGTWVSEGSDLSDLFAGLPFFYVWVEASFRADGQVFTEIRDRDGATYTTSGTWTTDTSTDPATISLQQTEPYVAALAGIYAIDGDTMTYEVVQLTPDYGYQAPTPELGFGSTAGPNLVPGINVQTFERN